LKKYFKEIGMIEKKDHPDAEKLAPIVREVMREMEKSADWEDIISQAVVAAYNIGKERGKNE